MPSDKDKKLIEKSKDKSISTNNDKKNVSLEKALDLVNNDVEEEESNASFKHNKKIQAGNPMHMDEGDNTSIKANVSRLSPREAVYNNPKTIFVKKTADKRYVLDNNTSYVTRHRDNTYTIQDEIGPRRISIEDGTNIPLKPFEYKLSKGKSNKNDLLDQPVIILPPQEYYEPYPYSYSYPGMYPNMSYGNYGNYMMPYGGMPYAHSMQPYQYPMQMYQYPTQMQMYQQPTQKNEPSSVQTTQPNQQVYSLPNQLTNPTQIRPPYQLNQEPTKTTQKRSFKNLVNKNITKKEDQGTQMQPQYVQAPYQYQPVQAAPQVAREKTIIVSNENSAQPRVVPQSAIHSPKQVVEVKYPENNPEQQVIRKPVLVENKQLYKTRPAYSSDSRVIQTPVIEYRKPSSESVKYVEKPASPQKPTVYEIDEDTYQQEFSNKNKPPKKTTYIIDENPDDELDIEDIINSDKTEGEERSRKSKSSKSKPKYTEEIVYEYE